MKAHNFSVGVGPANSLILWMEAEKERLFSGLEAWGGSYENGGLRLKNTYVRDISF